MLLIYGNEEAFSSVGAETLAEIIRGSQPGTRYWGVEVRPLMHEANVEP